MMKKILNVVLTTVLFATLFACNNEIESPLIIEEEMSDLSSPSTVVFMYEGKEYQSECKIVDGELFIIDNEVRKLSEELSKNPNLATLVSQDGKCIYYNSIEELKEKNDINNEISDDKIATKAQGPQPAIIRAQLLLYKDKNLKNKFADITCLGGATVRYPQMQAGADKELTSFHIKNTTGIIDNYFALIRTQYTYVTFYQNKNYGGLSVTYKLEYGDKELKIKNLGESIVPPLSLGYWDNQASSFEFSVRYN